MALTEIQLGQHNFLTRGGIYEMPLQQMRKKGEIDTDYVFREYPKMIRISQGMQTFQRQTKDCENHTIRWEETKEVFSDTVVNSEEEEERFLSGGRTSKQLEDDRQTLFLRCRAQNILADPTWSAVRLRRELGDSMNAAPISADDAMVKLEAELASLKKMAAMQLEIDALRAQMAPKPVAAVAEVVAAVEAPEVVEAPAPVVAKPNSLSLSRAHKG